MMMTKKLFQIMAVVFLIAGAYGCQGLGPGSGFQGGTEAGNPPTDGGFIGGTEAGNPPTGETTGGPGGDNDHPREGGTTCDLPDTPEKEGEFPCPTLGDQKVEQLTPEQMGILHDMQKENESKGELIDPLNRENYRKLSEYLRDFGQSESDDKMMVVSPETNAMILKNIK